MSGCRNCSGRLFHGFGWSPNWLHDHLMTHVWLSAVATIAVLLTQHLLFDPVNDQPWGTAHPSRLRTGVEQSASIHLDNALTDHQIQLQWPLSNVVWASVSTGTSPGPGRLQSNIASVRFRNVFWTGPCVAFALLFFFHINHTSHQPQKRK